MQTIVSLADLNQSNIFLAGGKAANLGELLRAGLPVPDGFCITTGAYQLFVQVNNLKDVIDECLQQIHGDAIQELDAASQKIRAAFNTAHIPGEMEEQIRIAYRALSNSVPVGVAVRSSATAEDLPDLSFAGQQDTFLNVIGETALLDAVIRCWSSLWTARAIGYRVRNHIDQQQIALAVVVQRMVNSETSGVLFTANPLTGKRTETVIDATYGLGEALVSGAVEPDHYVVDTLSQDPHQYTICSKSLGSKAVVIRGLPEGGTQTSAEQGAGHQALTDEQILELARIGKQSERHFGAPQDMEWAWAEGQLFVVQSRAVTSLFPLPEGMQPQPLQVCFSFAAWQGMLEPFSPLGQDVFSSLVVGFGRLFGEKITLKTQNVFKTTAMRLFVNITGLLRGKFSRKVITIFISAVDSACSSILETLTEDLQQYGPAGKFNLKSLLITLRGFSPVILRTLYNLAWPAKGRVHLTREIEKFVAATARKSQQVSNLPDLLDLLEEIGGMGPSIVLPNVLPGVIAGMAPYQIIRRIADDLPDAPDLTNDLTRGLSHNVTTEMDLKLWQTSQIIRADETSFRHFSEVEARDLSTQYLRAELPDTAQQAISDFLSKFGMRGVGEIDFYRKRWHEDPVHIMQVIKNYLLVDQEKANPQKIFTDGKEKALSAKRRLQDGFRMRRQPVRAWLVGFLAERFFELGGLRETPKFTISRFLDMLRQGLLRTGQSLVEQGRLDQSDDLFFLHLDELRLFSDGQLPDVKELIRQRQAEYQKEQTRKRLPRVILSDGTTYYEGIQAIVADDPSVLIGSPVSSGMVEGIVHVVLDPHQDQLAPGEILVCPGTDPAWTPLFLSAGGLVTEVGGMVTHGSVVAREYGIPAVVGVDQATTRLKTGQRIRLDGSTGRIMLLDGVPEEAEPVT